MLELRGVAKSFDATTALAHMDFCAIAGQTTALIGPSGCGKSTMLRLMIGLSQPDAGVVLFDGQPLTRDTIQKARQRIGYVIQEGGLFPHMTALRNIAIVAQYLGWEERKITARAAELAELTKFPIDGLERYPAQLSGGQRQRVSLMRALFLDPDALLLDEPLGALDPMIRSALQTDLKHIFASLGKTVILVTHDIGEAGYLADSITLMEAGRIVQEGSLRDLALRPASDFVSAFVNAQRSPLETLREGAQ